MRIVYLGTPDFSVLPLKKLVENGYSVVGVVCNKDKPVGRKQILTPPPVKVLAEELSLPVFQYDKIRVEGVEDLKRLKPDLMITCAFGQILSQEILDIPKLGVINIHASLLPKYTLKYLAGIHDDLLLISPSIIEPISKMKINDLGNHNPRLHSDEILIALAISAQTNPLAEMAIKKLGKLKHCQAHSTVILAQVDSGVFKKLKIDLTTEAEICAKKLYTK